MSQQGRLRAAGALAVVGTLLAGCGGTVARPMAGQTPAAQASGSVLVWYLKGSEAALLSTDWSGHHQSTFPMPQAPPDMPHYPGKTVPARLWASSVSPDGSRLVLRDGSIRDPVGAKVAQLDRSAGIVTWADDNRHFCGMTTPGYESFVGGTLTGPAILSWVTPGSASRTVATVGQFGPNATTTVEACSAHTGMAVLTERTASAITQAAKTGLDPVTKLVVVNLSDGSVLFERDYKVTTNPVGGTLVTVSSDGRYVAEVYTVVRQGPSAPVQIRALPRGNVVATLGPAEVQGFSGDDSHAFVGGASKPDGTRIVGQIVNWRTGEVQLTELGGPIVNASQPAGSAFMVLKPTTTNGFLENDLWLIPASGTSHIVDSDIVEVYRNN